MTSQRARDRLIERLREKGIRDLAVLEAIRRIPRHLFMDEALASRAYEDTALPIGHQQTISQPWVVARMTELLLEDGVPKKVLEIGTGSGYQAAILGALVPRVYSVERIQELERQARRVIRSLGMRNIRIEHSDGTIGLEQNAPYEGIMVTAAPPVVPNSLLEQLAEGGRMILPLGSGQKQRLVRIVRKDGGFEQTEYEPVVFVPFKPGQI